jgi:hypothetical protein
VFPHFKEQNVPTTAKIGFDAAVNGFSLKDSLDLDIDSSFQATEEAFNPGEYRDIELYGGPSDGIEFVFVKVTPDDQKPTAAMPANCNAAQSPRFIQLGFALDNQEPDRDLLLNLKKSVLLMGRAAQDLMPPKLERVCIKNNFSVPVKVQILGGRKRVIAPRPLQKDG